MTDINPAELKPRLKALGLFGLVACWDYIADKPWLQEVLAIEERESQKRSLERRLRHSRVSSFKPITEFDWNWPKKIDREAIDELFTLGFIKAGHNTVLIGPNGVGKSMILKNVAHQHITPSFEVTRSASPPPAICSRVSRARSPPPLSLAASGATRCPTSCASTRLATRARVGWSRRDDDYPVLFERCQFWAACRDNEGVLVAFGYMSGMGLEHGYIEDVIVDPAHQRRGLGRAVVLGLLTEARRRGTAIVTVTFDATHRQFYEACGFGIGNAGVWRATPTQSTK